MNVSPTISKRKLVQGSVNSEQIPHVKPTIFELNKQISQPALGQIQSSSVASLSPIKQQPYYLQHNALLFHSPTSSKLSLKKLESSPFSLQLSQCKSSKTVITEPNMPERVDFASYVRIKQEENKQKYHLGQSLRMNPSQPSFLTNKPIQNTDKTLGSQSPSKKKDILLSTHLKRNDWSQQYLQTNNETFEQVFAQSTNTLSNILNESEIEAGQQNNEFIKTQKQGLKTNLKGQWPDQISRESQSEFQAAESYKQENEKIRYQEQGNKIITQSSQIKLQRRQHMSLTSRKMRNSFTPSNKNNGQDCYISSELSNQQQSQFELKPQEQNSNVDLNLSSSLPALQVKVQYKDFIKTKDRIRPDQGAKSMVFGQINQYDQELDNLKNKTKVSYFESQDGLTDISFQKSMSQTTLSKWRLQERHSKIITTERLEDINLQTKIDPNPASKNLEQFRRSSIQQEKTIQQRFDQNKIFEPEPKKQIISVTPTNAGYPSKQGLQTHIKCYTEDNTPISNQLTLITKQNPNLLQVDMNRTNTKGTSSISISSIDGMLSSDQEGKSSSTMPAKETSVDITPDETKQLSQDRESNKNILGSSPSLKSITNQQQQQLVQHSSLVHIQQRSQKYGFSELISQDNQQQSNRGKHCSSHEGIHEIQQPQQNQTNQKRIRNSLKPTIKTRRSVFVLSSVPPTPSGKQFYAKNSTLAYLQYPTEENIQGFERTAEEQDDKKILHEISFLIPNLVKALCGDTYSQLKHDLCQFCTDDFGSLAFSISQLIQGFCSTSVSHFISPFKLCQSLIDRVLDVLLQELRSLKIVQSSIDVFQKAFEMHSQDILAESLEEKLGGISQQKRIISEVIDYSIQNSSNILYEAKTKSELIESHLKAIKSIFKYNGDDNEGNEYRSEFKTVLNYSAVDVFESKKAFLLVLQKNSLFYEKEFCFKIAEQIERTRYQMASGMSLYRLYSDESLKKSIKEFILKLQCLTKIQKKEMFVDDLIDYVLSPKVTSMQVQKNGKLTEEILKESKEIFDSHLRLEQEFTENIEYMLTFNYKFKKLEWILHSNPTKHIQGGMEELILLFNQLLAKELQRKNPLVDYSDVLQTENFTLLIQLFFSSYDGFNVKDALFSFHCPVIEERQTLVLWLQIFKEALEMKCSHVHAQIISNLTQQMVLSKFQIDANHRKRDP